MLKYLKTVPQLRSTAELIVCGNQSADMDSCCTALMTAYLSTTVDGRPSVPLIQIPRDDLRLRKDIVYVLHSLGIDESWLLFLDDMSLTESSKLFLVDHNAPTVPGEPVAVIDHHAIEDPNVDLSKCSPHRLVKSGSCMSAVVDFYAKNSSTGDLFRSDPVMAPLALSPIVQDTGNLTQKVEDTDVEAVKLLRDWNPSLSLFSPFTQFSEMKAEKKNLEGLSARDLLRKDYKQWGTIGISSLPKLFNKLAKKNYNIADALEAYAQESHLDVMIGLANGKRGPQEIYTRQLAIWGPNKFDVAAACPDLELQLEGVQPTLGGRQVRFYNQRNTAASRKQVAPDVKRAFAEYTK